MIIYCISSRTCLHICNWLKEINTRICPNFDLHSKILKAIQQTRQYSNEPTNLWLHYLEDCNKCWVDHSRSAYCKAYFVEKHAI